MTSSNLVHPSSASAIPVGASSLPLDMFKSIVSELRNSPLKLMPLQLFAGSGKRNLDQQVRADTFSTF